MRSNTPHKMEIIEGFVTSLSQTRYLASQALECSFAAHSLASLKLCLASPEANLSFRCEARLMDSFLLNCRGSYTLCESINSLVVNELRAGYFGCNWRSSLESKLC